MMMLFEVFVVVAAAGKWTPVVVVPVTGPLVALTRDRLAGLVIFDVNELVFLCMAGLCGYCVYLALVTICY